MKTTIIINDIKIEATNYIETQVGPKNRRKISFEFLVEHSRYREITTLLYKNNFIVKEPSQEIEFAAEIYSYSTSITNLYEEDAVGNFKIELIEKVANN